jgi:uncharacterized membrane protein
MRAGRLSAATLLVVTLAGCANLTPTEKRIGGGTLAGAAGGAAIGAMAGHAGIGTAIGAGVGLLGGIAYDQHKKAEERAYQKGVQDGRQSP